jgi:hypothetical protein
MGLVCLLLEGLCAAPLIFLPSEAKCRSNSLLDLLCSYSSLETLIQRSRCQESKLIKLRAGARAAQEMLQFDANPEVVQQGLDGMLQVCMSIAMVAVAGSGFVVLI